MRTGLREMLWGGAAILAASCAAPGPRAPTPTEAAPEAGAPEAAAPVERPFAATPLQAQTMIQAQIDDRIKSLWACVADLRKRTNDAHRAVAVNIGIDQEGRLVGVAATDAKQGEIDPALKACLTEALRGAMFPRSHTGIITVKQVFRDAVVP